jgi:hypothetical protein
MKAVCKTHGEQEFTPPTEDAEAYCTRCVAECNRHIGEALYEDLFWRKYGDNLRRSFAK